MGAHLDAGAVAPQETRGPGHVEGQAPVVHDPADAPQHLGLGHQLRAGEVVKGLVDLPMAPLGVDDADDPQMRGIQLGQGQAGRVQPPHRDRRQGRQCQGRAALDRCLLSGRLLRLPGRPGASGSPGGGDRLVGAGGWGLLAVGRLWAVLGGRSRGSARGGLRDRLSAGIGVDASARLRGRVQGGVRGRHDPTVGEARHLAQPPRLPCSLGARVGRGQWQPYKPRPSSPRGYPQVPWWG